MSKSKFASAAIAFFAESGLDPTEERAAGLASLGQKVGEGVANVRAHNADIGNRLFAMMRAWEKTLYTFMQQQEMSLLTYLQVIESNILRHQVAVESNLLHPMLEQVIKGVQEAYVGRVIDERTLLKITGRPETDWPSQNATFTRERDQLLVAQLREFAAAHPLPSPKPTAKPAVTPVPPKPTMPASTAPPPPGKS